jgi:hypothetical protein
VPATRPIEVLQPIQALADARGDYLDAVITYNTAQFRLFHALGRAPLPEQAGAARTGAVAEPVPPAPAADQGAADRAPGRSVLPGSG